MRRAVITSACAAVLAGACGFANATIVFRDDFENITAGAYPDAGNDLDPIAQTGVWGLTEGTISSVQVSTDYSPINGTRALVLNRNGAANDLRANLSNAVPAAPADPVKISFKYKDPSPDSAFGGVTDCMELLGYNDTDSNYDNQIFGIRIFKGWGNADDVYVGFGADASYGNPGNSTRFINAAGTGPASQWQQVELTMDFVNKTYTFALNGNTLPGTTNIAFNGDAATASQIQQFMFYHLYSTNSRFVIDDVVVESVPEPTSMALLALGGAAAFGRRRALM